MPKVWLITGSSGSLGRTIAEAALAAGDKVLATANERANGSDRLTSGWTVPLNAHGSAIDRVRSRVFLFAARFRRGSAARGQLGSSPADM